MAEISFKKKKKNKKEKAENILETSDLIKKGSTFPMLKRLPPKSPDPPSSNLVLMKANRQISTSNPQIAETSLCRPERPQEMPDPPPQTSKFQVQKVPSNTNATASKFQVHPVSKLPSSSSSSSPSPTSATSSDSGSECDSDYERQTLSIVRFACEVNSRRISVDRGLNKLDITNFPSGPLGSDGAGSDSPKMVAAADQDDDEDKKSRE